MEDRTFKVFTIPGLAKVIGKSPDTVRLLVESKKLKATNDSQGHKRPRWSILWSDYLEYREQNSNRQSVNRQAAIRQAKPRRQHI